MSGSIDLNTNRGVAVVLLLAGIAGGGVSTLKDQLVGPGGEWETIVTSQAVQAEQIKALTKVLEDGFDKLSTSQAEALLAVHDLDLRIEQNKYRIDQITKELTRLQQSMD